MYKLVLLRHGESQWNQENRFTGWTDVPLAAKGVEEAREAGRTFKKEGLSFDLAFSSLLKRANQTLHYALEEMGELWIPTVKERAPLWGPAGLGQERDRGQARRGPGEDLAPQL
jgi:2,3-bisphosphoglycerate-dependent phosphoglycerate mutase